MNIYDDFGKGLHLEFGTVALMPAEDASIFHMHPHYELLLVPDEGVNTTIINGRTVEIRYPMAILTAPFAMHFTYFREAATPLMKRYVLYFDESYIHGFGEPALPVHELLGNSNAVIFDISEVADRIRSLVKVMIEMKPTTEGLTKPATHAQELIGASIFFVLREAMALNQTGVRISENNYVIDVMKYIISNLEENLTIPLIAEHFFISRDKLCRDFRRHVQMNIGDFISTARLNLARKYLMDGKLTVKEIATKCGFENDVYFYSFFKRHEGCTPKEYAKAFGREKK